MYINFIFIIGMQANTPRIGEALQKIFHHGVRDNAPPDMVCPLTQPAHMCSSGLYRGTGHRLVMGCTVECARYKPLPPIIIN